MNQNNNKDGNMLNPGTLLNQGCFSRLGQGGFVVLLPSQKNFLSGNSRRWALSNTSFKQPGKGSSERTFFQDFCSRDSRTNMVKITNTDKKMDFQKLVDKMVKSSCVLQP